MPWSMFNELLQQFMGSPQGSAALQSLQQQHGLDPEMAQRSLGAATEGAAQALHQADGGSSNPLANVFSMLGGGAGGNAITGALSGMLGGGGGGGLGGAVQGGLSGLVMGQVGNMIATRTGVNPQMASAMAATLAPHILNYIQHRGAGQAGAAPQGSFPQSAPNPSPDAGTADVPPWKRLF
jgi:hypothetical protein